MKNRRTTHALGRLRVAAGVSVALVGLCALAVVAGPAPAAQAAIPTLTRAEIIARAESAIGASYSWGRESWTPNLGGGTGPDCSGFALKCWETPRTMLYQEEDGQNAVISPRYT
ncbi:MAG: hypothetical protein H5T84_08080, partial [Thermoleophilia bacterium]|nr:hypothetical protein [Thermoleophilia bacterium]